MLSLKGRLAVSRLPSSPGPRASVVAFALAGVALLPACSPPAGISFAAADTPVSATAGIGVRAVTGEAPDVAVPAPHIESPPTTDRAVAADDVVGPAPVIDAGSKGLATGSRGGAVTQMEGRLAALRFNPGKADGSYDGPLAMAVMAFQKQQDLPRTGRADPATLAKLAAAPLGTPMVAAGGSTRVEIDLKRQIAQFWKDGKLQRVLAVSTGNGQPYCAPKDKGGACDVAITPGGSFRADRKIEGVRESALGSLYDPVYFYGGIALHGSPSIPATAASHGCVRVPMWESRWVYNTVQLGDPIYVVGGKIAPVPFGEAAPIDDPNEVPPPAAA